MKAAALNTGSAHHLLDHIAPLCFILGIPLYVDDERVFSLARHYYPQIEVRYEPLLDLSLFAPYDTLFKASYWTPHFKEWAKTLYQKTVRLVFCPHGQSDKGLHAPLLAPYGCQEATLLYGDLMEERLRALQVKPPLSAKVGNFRLLFYRDQAHFYDPLVEQEVFSRLDPKKKTVLYAPTWNDADRSSSYFTWTPTLLQELPSDWNLIFKLHPLLEERNPAEFYSLLALVEKQVEKKKGVLLLDAFPPIYPLLARVDAYLGDASSIGYDFLAFNRPLFFFPTPHPLPLHECGTLITHPRDLFFEEEALSARREALYQKTFAPLRSLAEVRETIFNLEEAKR